MLYRMAALVSCHRSGSHTGTAIDIGTQVEGFVHGVVMVGEGSLHHFYLHILDIVVVKHLFCHVATRHAIVHGYLGVFLEFGLDAAADDTTDYHQSDEDNPVDGSTSTDSLCCLKENQQFIHCSLFLIDYCNAAWLFLLPTTAPPYFTFFMLNEIRFRFKSTSITFTWTCWWRCTTSLGSVTRRLASCEMCTKPS